MVLAFGARWPHRESGLKRGRLRLVCGSIEVVLQEEYLQARQLPLNSRTLHGDVDCCAVTLVLFPHEPIPLFRQDGEVLPLRNPAIWSTTMASQKDGASHQDP